MDVDLPGIYVDRIVPATVDKQIEFMTLAPEPEAEAESQSGSGNESDSSTSTTASGKDAAKARREKIARRAAKELKDGYYCNLGVGMPVLAANYTEPGVNVWLQSENGILGMGPYPTRDQVDA